MNTGERAKLRATFAAKKAEGLRDMKFLAASPTETLVEDVCAEVNHWFAEEERGNVTVVETWGESHRVAHTPN